MSEEKKTNLYDEKRTEAEKKLEEYLQEVEDLKVSYNYSEIKQSNIPFQIQEQIQLIDRMRLAKGTKNEWAISEIKNNGHFMALLQEFDFFEKKEPQLREYAMEVITIERAIKRANEFLKNNSEVVSGFPLIENADLFAICHAYLVKAKQFDTFDKQAYRAALVKQAMLSKGVPTEKIEQGIKNRVITAKDAALLQPTVLGVSKEASDHYKEAYAVISSHFANASKQEEKKTTDATKEVFHKRVVGTTFANEDGTKRQDIILAMKEENDALPIPVDLVRGEYKGKPSISVSYHGKQVGFLDQTTANAITETYPENALHGYIEEISGGDFEKTSVDGEKKKASFGLAIAVEVELTKDAPKTAEKVKEEPLEQKAK